MRITRHQMFMEMAHAVAKRSTCPRLNVGAVIVSSSLEIYTGYNGSKSGEDHCTDVGCLMEGGNCKRAIHAEINALQRIPYAPNRQHTLYVTNSPCSNCTWKIVNSGQIAIVYFENEYHDTSHLIEFTNHGILVLRLVPNGCIMNLQGDVIET